jgi:hypothetical protein
MQKIELNQHDVKTYQLFFYIIVAIGFILIVTSYPMMKMRFDIWDHVDRIRIGILDADQLANLPKKAWYLIWAAVFKATGITDIYTIATVVHRTQFIICVILIYSASKQIYTVLLSLQPKIKIENNWLSSLALSSVLVWVTIIGTHSFFQQAWIMWYSVTYQITLPMLFLSLGLLVNLLGIQQPRKIVILKISISTLLLIGVYILHAGELAYLIFYIPILVICFGTRYKYSINFLLKLTILTSMLIYLGVIFYTDQVPALLSHLKNRDFSKIYSEIISKGTWNAVHGGNRYAANWKELYKLSIYFFLPLTVLFSLKVSKINNRVFCFMILSLVFCFIPTYIYSAGLVSLISYDGIVNRYYFASYIFLLIPLAIYFLADTFIKNTNPIYIVATTLLIMLSTYMYSKYIEKHGIYYENVQSISNRILAKKIDIGLSEEEINDIGRQLVSAEQRFKPDEFMYCGAFESLYVAYYIFGKRNLIFTRLGNHTLEACEAQAKKDNKRVVYIN